MCFPCTFMSNMCFPSIQVYASSENNSNSNPNLNPTPIQVYSSSKTNSLGFSMAIPEKRGGRKDTPTPYLADFTV